MHFNVTKLIRCSEVHSLRIMSPCNVIKSFIHVLYVHLFFMNVIFYSEVNNEVRIIISKVGEKYKAFLQFLN